jgi:hypothetical protein
LNWACLAWQSLHKSGLTIFNDEKEELKVRSYAAALSLIYYKYCHRTAFSGLKGFQYWSQLIIETFKNELLIDINEDDELLSRVTGCLLEQQSDDFELNSELWINCAESYQGFVFSIRDKAKLQNNLINENYDDFNFSQGKRFILGDIDNILTYESISGL